MQDEHSRERVSYARPVGVPGTELMVAYDSARLWRVLHDRYVPKP